MTLIEVLDHLYDCMQANDEDLRYFLDLPTDEYNHDDVQDKIDRVHAANVHLATAYTHLDDAIYHLKQAGGR